MSRIGKIIRITLYSYKNWRLGVEHGSARLRVADDDLAGSAPKEYVQTQNTDQSKSGLKMDKFLNI